MTTDQLISALSRDVAPVRSTAVRDRIALGIVAGSLISTALLAVVLGVRPDLDQAMLSPGVWMKLVYTISLAIAALLMVAQLTRPESRTPRGAWLFLIPVLLLTCVGVLELLGTPSGKRLEMWLAHSWALCPWRVLVLAAPIFVGLLWSFRGFAPTQLRLAGAAAGAAAGAFAAVVYCLHCAQVSAIFVVTWYSLGILLATGVGALIGPRLMRW